MPLIIPANTLSADDYEISNSVRFNTADSPKLQRTTGSNGDRRQFTLSVWLKISQDASAGMTIFSWNDGGHRTVCKIDDSSEQISMYLSDSQTYELKTNQSFRDYSAWFHLCINMDTEQSTASDRVAIYINGTKVTSLATANYPAEDWDSPINSNTENTIGRDVNHDNKPYDGYMAELFWIDGNAYLPTKFGKFNDNGVWVPIDAKAGLTFGTHGYYMEFKQTGTGTNSSGIGADTSGNDNHYAVTGLSATDITTDTPTNNFCTLNPLMNSSQASYSEGNLDEACNDNYGVGGSMAVANGKWYWEVKIKAGDNNLVGVANGDEVWRFPVTFGINNYSIAVYGVNGIIYKEGSTVENVSDTYGANDIIGVRLDLDSGTRTVSFYKNNSAFGSAVTLPSWDIVVPMIRKGGSSQTSSFNFGNPSFSISSGNADDNGYGNFEYDVPTGYYALCTKNLAEFG